MQLFTILPLVCLVAAAPEGGLFGLGLLGGGDTTTTIAGADTTAAPGTTTTLVDALTTTVATDAATTSAIQNILDVLTGKVGAVH